MRYGILCDIHSNLEALNAVIEDAQSLGIDKYLCAGDIVGYTSNPAECLARIEELAEVIIAGNHDWATVNLSPIGHFNDLAKEAILWTRRNLDKAGQSRLQSLKLTFANEDLTLVHGTLNNPQEFSYMTDGYAAEETFRLLKSPLCFIGHTHIPGFFIDDNSGRIIYREDNFLEVKPGNRYIVNAGSVGQPRDGNPKASYCIYDTNKKEINIRRVEYDCELTREKIINAGLPGFLGDRLLLGR